jgi:hypothetical protein
MTRTRRRSHHPIALMLSGLAALLTLDLAISLLHYALFLVLPVAGFLACRYWTRRSGVQRVVAGKMLPADAAQLRADNDQLRARLAEAEASAQAAWDAAASVPPRPERGPSTARDRLLSDRLGGVHDLFGSHDDRRP